MHLQAQCVIVRYCLRFVVVEVNGRSAGWSLVAVMSLLPDVVVVVLSGRLQLTGRWEGFTG